MHYRHVPNDCPRKAVTVKVLQMEDSEHFDDAPDFEDSVTIGKINGFEDSEQTLSKHFQIQKNSNPTPSIVNINISPPCPATADPKDLLARESIVTTAQVNNVDI